MNYKNSRGWRNNNPLNIRRGERWQGLATNQNDPEFCIFYDATYGYRAGAKVLMSYYRVFAQLGRPFTVENIIRRWAPANENDTENYILSVCARTGFDRRTPLCRPNTPKGAWQMAVLMAAMTCVECGCWWQHVDFYSVCLGVFMAYRIAIDDEKARRIEY